MEIVVWLPEYGVIMDGQVHISIVVAPASTTQNMDLPIHYHTIFRQPNEELYLLFSF